MANRKVLKFEYVNGCKVPVSHALNIDGYFRKQFWIDGKPVSVMYHRYVWELRHGPIPDGYEVDHKCNNRACCNVEHLQVIHGSKHASQTNIMRYAPRKASALKYWLEHKCTGTNLGELFGVTFSCACSWIRGWKLQTI